MSEITRQLFENYHNGLQYKRQNDYDHGIACFLNAIELFAHNYELLKGQNISFVEKIFIEISKIYYSLRNYEKATDTCVRGLFYFPENSELLLITSYSYFQLGNFEKTLFYLEKINKKTLNLRQIEKVLRLSASCYSLQNNYDRAIECLNRLIELRDVPSYEYCINTIKKISSLNLRPQISVCINTYNSGQYIFECIESVMEIADEIIVLDTGSTDNTLEICTGLSKGLINQTLTTNTTPTIQIYETQWENDFSKARNELLGYAKMDWILLLDSDQEFIRKSSTELMNIIKDPFRIGYYINVIMPDSTKRKVLRLFRNNLGIEYEGIIHEQVYKSINRVLAVYPELSVGDSGINLNDYSYENEKILEEKSKRNISLLKKALEDKELEPLSKIYYFIKLAEEDHNVIHELLENNYEYIKNMPYEELRKYPFIIRFYEFLAQKELTAGEINEALAVINEGLKIFSPSIELNYLKAKIFELTGNYEGSLFYYEKSRALLQNIDKLSFNSVNITKMTKEFLDGIQKCEYFLKK